MSKTLSDAEQIKEAFSRMTPGELKMWQKFLRYPVDPVIDRVCCFFWKDRLLPRGFEPYIPGAGPWRLADFVTQWVRSARCRRNAPIWKNEWSEPPEGFRIEPLVGEQWQIAWALRSAGVLTHGTPKELVGDVRDGEILWGRKLGRRHEVFLHSEKVTSAQARRAAEELAAIIDRGPFHPFDRRLPSGYCRNRSNPLRSRNQDILAAALHRVGLLDEAARGRLRGKLREKGGGVWGRFEDGWFSLYFSDKFTAEDVASMHAAMPSYE